MEMSNDNIPTEEWRIAERMARTGLANARFAALPPARKRVALAKDVLKWLASGKLVAPGMNSYYMEVTIAGDAGRGRTFARTWADPVTVGRDPRTPQTVNGYTCTACAIGGLVACAVERGEAGGSLYRPDGYLLGNGNGASEIHTALAGVFDVDQLCLIEMAFELDTDPYVARRGCREKFADAWDFGLAHDDRTERMQAIMQNIIANKGTFIP